MVTGVWTGLVVCLQEAKLRTIKIIIALFFIESLLIINYVKI